MRFAVYLSSTLKDLEEERRAVQEALGDQCIVRHSYRASEQALVASCLDDVAQARSPRSAKRTAWSGLCSRAHADPASSREGVPVRPRCARRNVWLAKGALAELPRALQDVFVHRWYAAAETKDGDEKARGLIDHLDGRKDLVPETAFGGAEVSQSFREWC